MKLTLSVGRKNLQVEASKALYGVWRVASYPVAVLVGYMLFDVHGALFAGALMLCTYRGDRF